MHFEKHDCEAKKPKTCQILNWKFHKVSNIEMKTFCLVGFQLEFFQIKSSSMLNSNLVPPHVIFTSFFSIHSCTLTTYKIFFNSIKAFAAIQTCCSRFGEDLYFFSFLFARSSHFFPVSAWYMHKLAAASKIIDKYTRTAFVSHDWLIFENELDEII